jgi:hypothetical protein
MRLRTITVIFVLVCALAVPASASAYYSSGSGSDDSSIAARTPTELSQRIPTPAPTVSSETDGFHWGDAALGAGAAIGLLVPETEPEHRILGSASDEVGRTIQQGASQAMDKVEEAADQAERKLQEAQAG